MSDGTGSRWGSREARGDEDSEKKPESSKRADQLLSPHIHHPETEDVCIKL